MAAAAAVNPNVTLVGTLTSLWNASLAPNPDPDASIEIALCGYGSQIPRVAGESLFSTATTMTIEMQSGVPPDNEAGTFQVMLFSNDLILPEGTYYTVTVRNGNGDILQVNAYVLNAGGYDLSTLTPYDPNQPPPPLPPLVTNQLGITPWSVDPGFDGTAYTAWQITLAGDTEGAFLQNVVPGNLYTFIIQQDSNGNHVFDWPSSTSPTGPERIFNGALINMEPNSITIQTFVCDAAYNLYAIAGGTYYP